MTIGFITPVLDPAVGTVFSTKLTAAPNEEWSVNVRACIGVGTDDDIIDLRIVNPVGVRAYRCRTEAVQYGKAMDIEQKITLPAGWSLEARSGAGKVDATYTGTRRTTP